MWRIKWRIPLRSFVEDAVLHNIQLPKLKRMFTE
jgi:hypothetical protein